MALIGHQAQVSAFQAAFAGGRPHHAWLLTGPAGLGKALFAEEAAIWLLAGLPQGPGFAGAAASPAASLVAAGSHPDMRRLERTTDDKGKLRSAIRVDEVRALLPLFRQTPALAEWRVVIVDAADDMNTNAANALLKSLEEPPAQTLFLLVSHMPGRLLPTIRSRCRTLRFQALAEAEMRDVLAAATVPMERWAELLAVAQGNPGQALALADSDIAGMAAELEALRSLAPAAATAAALALSRSMGGKTGAERYAALLASAPALLARLAREAAPGRRPAALAAWNAASKLAAEAPGLQLLPEQVAFQLAMHVATLPA
jgi:DNA polymerase-3 subunit delta'